MTVMLCTAIIILLIILFGWYKWKTHKIKKLTKNIPGPPSIPIIGSAHIMFGLDSEGICKKHFELVETYGTIVKFWFGPNLWVYLADPSYIEAILTNEYATNKDPLIYENFKDMSNGIFVASGEKWKKLRKLANPTFNQKNLEYFIEEFNLQSKILNNVLEKKIGETSFNINHYIARCTLDIVCGTQMGVSTKEQTENTSSFAENLSAATIIIKHRISKIYLRPNFIFNMTEYSRQMKKYLHPLHNFVKEIIVNRKLARSKEEITSGDEIGKKRSIYLDSVLDHFQHINDDELAVRTTDMLIAGSDTTSVATSYAIMLMGTYPEIQDKVYKEVIEIIGTGDEDIKYSDLCKFVYLEMVLKEVLRHYTIPFVVRKIIKDQCIGDITLPGGTTTLLCLNAVHNDPRYWSHPSEFYPDHFLPENVAKRPKFSYVPFSGGPRSCPGYAFAMMSMKIMVATILRKYKIKSNFDMHNAQFTDVFMVEPIYGYPIQITKR